VLTAVPVALGGPPERRDRTGISPGGPALLPLDAGEQYRFTFAMDACIGCHACEVACAEQNDLPGGLQWRRVGEIEGGSYPLTVRRHVSMACNHCLEPSCLQGCPTLAFTKLANGVVFHDEDDCIGCQYCTWNCPYSVPVFDAARGVVSKCDMCLPRLDAGQLPACVGACPTNAIGVETVDVGSWRADHREADGPQLPSSDLTISTTRLVVSDDLPLITSAADDHTVTPEDPHWPLIVLTLLTQMAVGAVASVVFTGGGHLGAAAAFCAAALAMAASFGHLGRPLRAFKVLRNLRGSWLSREALAFGVFAATTFGYATAGMPALLGWVGVGAGVVGTYASARIYLVPARPAWNTPRTVASFFVTALALGPLFAALFVAHSGGLLAASAVGVAVRLALVLWNVAALTLGRGAELRGSAVLLLERFRGWFVLHVAAAVAGLCLLAAGETVAAFCSVAVAETVGRWLFYVTVVGTDIPGRFSAWRRP